MVEGEVCQKPYACKLVAMGVKEKDYIQLVMLEEVGVKESFGVDLRNLV